MTMFLDQVRSILTYDPGTGLFRWRQKVGCAAAGAVAGTIKPNGYRCIKSDKRNYYAHRLAWFYVHGLWPTAEIDHINCNQDDNRIVNLRGATGSQNQGNRRPQKGGQTKGITYHRRDKRWQAQIGVRGHHKYLGLFRTKAEAAAAYERAAKEHFGAFARAGHILAKNEAE